MARPADEMYEDEAAEGQREEVAYEYNDDELVGLVKNFLQQGDSGEDTDIAQQRADAFDAYYGFLPVRPKGSASGFVSRDVFDVVEQAKARLLRIFTSGRRVIAISSDTPEAEQLSDIAEPYLDELVWEKNDGFKLLSDAFHDGLLSKQAVAYRYWKKSHIYHYRTVTLPVEQLDVVLAEDDVELERIVEEMKQTVMIPTPMGVLPQEVTIVTAELRHKQDTSHCCIELIPPEDFFEDGSVIGKRKSRFMAHRTERTRSDLIAEGYDPELVNSISSADIVSEGATENARNRNDSTYRDRNAAVNEDERTLVTVYCAHLMVDMDGDGEAEMWKLLIGGDKLLDKERITEFPYEKWSPIELSHKQLGMSLADVSLDLQKSTTSTVRGIIDNIWRTNNPRVIADLQVVRNPRDLIDNPIGGVIDSPNPTSVTPMMQPGLNPATGMLVELLSQQKESRTGITRLAGGLNADALNKQNADDMVERLMNASNERILIMGRSFCEQFWKPLLKACWRISVEYDPRLQGLPGELPMKVHTALTPEHGAAQAQALMTMHGTVMANPMMQPLYGVTQQYELYSEVYELLGLPRIQRFVLDPSTPEGQAAIQQFQQKQAEAEAIQKGLASAQTKEKESKVAKNIADIVQTQKRDEANAAAAADKQELAEVKEAREAITDAAELALEAGQKRPVKVGE